MSANGQKRMHVLWRTPVHTRRRFNVKEKGKPHKSVWWLLIHIKLEQDDHPDEMKLLQCIFKKNVQHSTMCAHGRNSGLLPDTLHPVVTPPSSRTGYHAPAAMSLTRPRRLGRRFSPLPRVAFIRTTLCLPRSRKTVQLQYARSSSYATISARVYVCIYTVIMACHFITLYYDGRGCGNIKYVYAYIHVSPTVSAFSASRSHAQ